MKKIYFADRGKIVEHRVILEDGGNLYVDRLDKFGAVQILEEHLIGKRFFWTFEEAQTERIARIDELSKAFQQERLGISGQEKADKGDLQPLKEDE